MKHVHFVNPYNSIAMQRLLIPMMMHFPELYIVSEGKNVDEDADLNYHIPWHTMVGYEKQGNSKHVIMYTHCNPPDAPRLIDACARADKIICMSFTGRDELLSMGIDPTKIWVIYAAADQCQYRARVIGIAGWAQPNFRKRQSLLIDMAWKYDLSPYTFAIAGGGWENTAQVLQNLGVAVTLLNEIGHDKMTEFYNVIDLFLVTGYVEGGPLPLLEAMASGVKVLSPPFGYANDLLDQENTYENVDDLYQKIMDTFKDTMTLHSLARAWNWHDYAAENALVIGQLLGESVDLIPKKGMSRYAQLIEVIQALKPRNIVEIGTWSGNRAIQMIQEASKYNRVSYQGFDLFETQTGRELHSELSKPGWPQEVVKRRLGATDAEVNLIMGNTHDTLSENLIDVIDFCFIDGGHSERTIKNDWDHVRRKLHPNSVVVFDDYYHGVKPVGIGCNALYNELLSNPNYVVNLLPLITEAENGRMISMMIVRPSNANLHLQMQKPALSRSDPLHDDDTPGDMQYVWPPNVESPPDAKG